MLQINLNDANDKKSDVFSNSFEKEYISDFETSEEFLLYYSRSGNLEKLKKLFEFVEKEKIPFNINAKGTQKSNKGWTALHLASYFGNYEVVQLLLSKNCNVNVLNEKGDTPLHKAAFVGRDDIVTLLLKYNADVFIKNDEFKLAKNLAKNENVYTILEKVEERDLRNREECFILSAKNKDIEKMEELLSRENPVDINCQDKDGNTALHHAAFRGNKQVITFLLQQDNIDISIKNNKSLIAASLTHNIVLKKLLLHVKKPKICMLNKKVNKFEGLMLRRNKFRVWRHVWCVLEKGVLSFYNCREDAATWSKRRDDIYLESALIEAKDNSPFITIYFKPNYKLQLQIPSKSTSDKKNFNLNRQKWINSIQDHIDYSNNFIRQGFKIDDDNDENLDELLPTNFLQNLINTARSHQSILNRHISSLKQFMDEDLKILQAQLPESISVKNSMFLMNILKKFWPTLTFHLNFIEESCENTSTYLQDCLNLMDKQDKLRQNQLKVADIKVQTLETLIQVLAQEQHDFEKSVRSNIKKKEYPTIKELDTNFDENSTDCEEYFDAFDEEETNLDLDLKKSNDFEIKESEEFQVLHDLEQCTFQRDKLPAKMIARADVSLWSILKNCIGKELSKITMPVVFNEPLSFLQRLTENVSFVDILNLANESSDPLERIEYIGTYAVACLSKNYLRLNKPFNPLLGETYEYKDEKNTFFSLCEQVSHHPPISAYHVEGDAFRRFGSICPKLRFWGKSIEVKPDGMITLHLKKPNEYYTWSNVNCCIENIILGKLSFEQYGKMEILCSSNNLKAIINFKKAGWSGKDSNRIDGFIMDVKLNTKLKFLYGKWSDYLKSVDFSEYEKYMSKNDQNFKIPEIHELDLPNSSTFKNYGKNENAHKKLIAKLNNFSLRNVPNNLEENRNNDVFKKESNTNDEISQELNENGNKDIIVKSDSLNSLDIPNSKLLWISEPRPENSTDYYNFNKFTFKLNELNEKQKLELPRTDSRFRPDIRYLEFGDLDSAANEKNRLEEKQRLKRKSMKKENINNCPMWFKLQKNSKTNEESWVYTGNYFERKFDDCPDIF